MQIDPTIFKANDIRGRAAAPGAVLTAEVARLVGAAFGTYLQRAAGQRVAVVGYDNRNTSTALAQAAIQGLQAAGCDVIDIGMVSTPLVYWSAVRRGRAGGLMVTGSHLEPAQNGFKFCVGAASLHGAAIQHLRDLIATGNFTQGSATVTERPAIPEYIADLVQRFRMPRPLRLVIDAGNGTAGAVAPALFRDWGHRVTCLYCTPDGDYPNHQPNPQKAENMCALCAKVREVRADIGIAFDGDADRIGVADERGAIIAPDRVIALLARDVLQRCPGGKVVADVTCSQALFDAVRQAGGTPVMWMTGHALIKQKLQETGAVLGGEVSGHIIAPEGYFPFDDGYVAAARLLQVVGASGGPPSALDATLPALHSSPVYRPHCPPDIMPSVMAHVKAQLSSAGEIIDLDGVRVQFEHGWGLLRLSNTEPVLSMRFEGETEADVAIYRDLFFAALRAFPQIDLSDLV